jgi:hypothetical protein
VKVVLLLSHRLRPTFNNHGRQTKPDSNLQPTGPTMILRIYQVGREQSHWMKNPGHLDAKADTTAPIRIICEDRGCESVTFTGHLLFRHSPDGRMSCVNVLLNNRACPVSSPSASPNPDSAPRFLCIPLSQEAVSRLCRVSGHPHQFELRLQDVRIAFGPASAQPAPTRTLRPDRVITPLPLLPAGDFSNTSERHTKIAAAVC